MIANPDPNKSTIRVALEEAVVTGMITGISAMGGLLATNIELTTRPFLIAGMGALLAALVTYARKRQIDLKSPGG